MKFQLDGGRGARSGALTACIGLGSLLGSIAMLFLARRVNKGEPVLAGFFLTAIAIACVGISDERAAVARARGVGGFCGVVFVGLSTVVVQTMARDEMRARAMAIWAAAFVGLLPFGALITTGLAAWLGAGGAVAGRRRDHARRRRLRCWRGGRSWAGSAARRCPRRASPRPRPSAVALEGRGSRPA